MRASAAIVAAILLAGGCTGAGAQAPAGPERKFRPDPGETARAAEQARAKAAADEAADKAAGDGGAGRLYNQASALEREGRNLEAVKVYRDAARRGSGKAAKRLGDIYRNGVEGIPRDFTESLNWYNRARTLGEN